MAKKPAPQPVKTEPQRRVRMLTSQANVRWMRQYGAIVLMPKCEAEQLIRAGQAEPAVEVKPRFWLGIEEAQKKAALGELEILPE